MAMSAFTASYFSSRRTCATNPPAVSEHFQGLRAGQQTGKLPVCSKNLVVTHDGRDAHAHVLGVLPLFTVEIFVKPIMRPRRRVRSSCVARIPQLPVRGRSPAANCISIDALRPGSVTR